MVVAGETKRFVATSPVAQFWLANCVGFMAQGGCRGKVERIFAAGDPHVAGELEIRRGRRRRRRVPVSAVVEIVPGDRVVVLRRPIEPRSHETRDRALRLTRSATVATGVALAALGRTSWRLSRRAWLVGAPTVAAGSRRAGRETVRLVRSIPWQQYGRSVRSVTTKLWQDLSTRSSRLRTTSSAWISAKRSSRRARTTSST